MFGWFRLEDWLECIYIIAVGVLIQQILARIVFPWIRRKTENKFSETLQNIFLNSVERPVNFLVILSAVYAGLRTTPLHTFSPELFLNIYRSVIIVAFYTVFYNIFNNSKGNLTNLAKRFNVDLDPLLINLGSSVLRILTVVIGFLTLAREWNYDMSGVIAGLGLGGLALAMASKDSLSNIFGGFVILTDKPFTIGDWINAAGFEGGVEDVSFRSTRIRTAEQGIVYVPNTNLTSVPITNFSRRRRRRASFTVALSYSTTKDQLAECISNIRAFLNDNQNVTHGPGDILVVFSGYGETGLNMYILYYAATSSYNSYMEINNEIYFKIMDIVYEAGAQFAYPSRSLYIQEPISIINKTAENKSDLDQQEAANEQPQQNQ